MKIENISRNVHRVMKKKTQKIHEQYPDFPVYFRPSTIHKSLGNMFGITRGGVQKGLTHLVNEGMVIREERGKKPVFSLPPE